MISETKSILKGNNAIAEYLLCREEDQGTVRLHKSTAMATALLYIRLSNSECRDPYWMITRGERQPESIRDHISPGSCCSESGVVSKIQSFVLCLHRSLWEAELPGLVETLACMQDAYLDKGGNTNVQAESAFSLCRMLGVKLPYMPVKLESPKVIERTPEAFPIF